MTLDTYRPFRCTGQSEDGSRPDAAPCADYQRMTQREAFKHLDRTGHEFDSYEVEDHAEMAQ